MCSCSQAQLLNHLGDQNKTCLDIVLDCKNGSYSEIIFQVVQNYFDFILHRVFSIAYIRGILIMYEKQCLLGVVH